VKQLEHLRGRQWIFTDCINWLLLSTPTIAIFFSFVEKVHMKETKQMTLQLDRKVHDSNTCPAHIGLLLLLTPKTDTYFAVMPKVEG